MSHQAMGILPISAVIATRNRAIFLNKTLETLYAQTCVPAEVIIVDASPSFEPALKPEEGSGISLKHIQTSKPGAAVQRNFGVEQAGTESILFLDDDIIMEKDCLERLWQALEADEQTGGVSAMITNQKYHPPGKYSRVFFKWLNGGKEEKTYAGRCLGPGLTQLPDDDPDLKEVQGVDWLNTTCTLYRRNCLPSPPFPRFFYGASIAEDLCLSLLVAKKGVKLANVRKAEIFHDSQQGEHKKNVMDLGFMEFFNRHYIMRQVLGKKSMGDYIQFYAFMLFYLAGTLRQKGGGRQFTLRLLGYFKATWKIILAPNGGVEKE